MFIEKQFLFKFFRVLENVLGDWRDDSEVTSTGCSSRGPEFNSQQPQNSLQPSVMRCDGLFWPAGIHAGRTLYT